MAFVTPLCLIGVTALVLVVRMGRKLALERTLEWDDGKMVSLPTSYLGTQGQNAVRREISSHAAHYVESGLCFASTVRPP